MGAASCVQGPGTVNRASGAQALTSQRCTPPIWPPSVRLGQLSLSPSPRNPRQVSVFQSLPSCPLAVFKPEASWQFLK